MEKEALKRIFEFIEEKEGHNAPFMWKLKNDISFTKEELNIKGDLDLSISKITSLPEGLKVGGDLYLRFSSITSLPEGLEVGGDLYLMFSTISSLPEGLKVGGDIIIKRTLLEDYTNEELREMIKPGFIKGKIYR